VTAASRMEFPSSKPGSRRPSSLWNTNNTTRLGLQPEQESSPVWLGSALLLRAISDAGPLMWDTPKRPPH
jgi:hypothetical protein